MAEKKTSSRRDDKPPVKPAPARRDWEAVERDYRTGRLSLRELAAKHGGSHQAIGQRAKKSGWTQDLSKAVRAATNARVIEQTLANEVARTGQTVANVVLAAAELNKQVILGHRQRVGQATGVAMRLLAELDATTTRADEIGALFEVLTYDLDDSSKAAAQRQLSEFMRLHNRVASVHKLMDALSKAQTLERQAFNIDDEDRGRQDDATLTDDALRRKLARLGIAVNLPTVIDV